MNLALITAPTAEPISLAEIKSYLRVTATRDDAYIKKLLLWARKKVESDTGRAMLTQTWEQHHDGFVHNPILIGRAPLASVVSVKYYDTDNVEQTWSSDEYEINEVSIPGRLRPVSGSSYPATYSRMNAVTIRFTAGATSVSDVPVALIKATEYLVNHWYDNREALIFGTIIGKVPNTYAALISSMRVHLKDYDTT